MKPVTLSLRLLIRWLRHICVQLTHPAMCGLPTSSVSGTAVSGLFEAGRNDTSFHLVMDFADSYGVTDIAGLVVYGNNVSGLVRMMAYAGYKMLSYYPYSGIFYLPDGKNRKIYLRHVF